MPSEPGNPPPAASVRLQLPLARASGARPDPSGHEGHREGRGPPSEPGNPPPAASVRLQLPLARASSARPDGHREGRGPLCVRSHVRVRAAACTSGAGGAEMWPLTESQLGHACHFVACSFRVHLSELGLFSFCYLTDEAVMVQRG